MNAREYLSTYYGLHPGHKDVIEIANATRADLAEFAHKLGLKTGVEVGVAAGKYSQILAEANPQMTIWGVDPHESYPTYKDYVKEDTFRQLEADAHEKLDKYPNYHFMKMYSMEALEKFDDNSLDFVYIDGNHAEPYVSQDINEWAKKVRPGGIVSGDDYARIKRDDTGESSKNWAVIPALDKYREEHPEIVLYIWGLNAKNGLKRDSGRSWMFIK